MEGFALLLALLSVPDPDPFLPLRRFPPYDYAVLQHNQAMLDCKYLEKFASYHGRSLNGWGFEFWLSPAQFNSPSRESIIAAASRARYRRAAWGYLRSACRGDYDERLEAIKMLRDLLSDDDWAAGQMPW